METASLIFVLLVVYQIKHFVADYPLQGSYMLRKFMPGWDFALPLACHAGVHALLTLGILYLFAPHLWYLCFVDFAIHFLMDRIKAGPKYLGRYKALSGDEFKRIFDTYTHTEDDLTRSVAKSRLRSNVLFWWSLGVDQMVHHLTHYYIIFAIVMNKVWSC